MESVYRRPPYLITYIFASHAVLLGFTAAGCIIFASNAAIALGYHPSPYEARGTAILVICFITLIHGLVPRLGVKLMNTISFLKVVVLLAIVLSGAAVLLGVTRVKDPYASFRDPFKGTDLSAYFVAMASFKVANSFVGWSNAGYVLQEVKNPVPTIKSALS